VSAHSKCGMAGYQKQFVRAASDHQPARVAMAGTDRGWCECVGGCESALTKLTATPLCGQACTASRLIAQNAQ
jgi:hypothetical protein